MTDVIPSVCSSLSTVLAVIMDHFWNKPFIRHEDQDSKAHTLFNTDECKEGAFKETVSSISIGDVPPFALVIGSHSVLKLKAAD